MTKLLLIGFALTVLSACASTPEAARTEGQKTFQPIERGYDRR